MPRTKLADRRLPTYSKAEETFNAVSHMAGGGLALLAAVACVWKAARGGEGFAIVTACLYGAFMVALYAMSAIYHGLRASTGKKVLQVLDHCAIYFMIAGTYTPIALCALRPLYPALAWTVFGLEWALVAVATALTAVDLKRYRVFSMVCYIVMGWCVVAFLPQVSQAITKAGLWWLLAGGLCYTVGAVLYSIGSKRPWFHAIFHLFVVAGTVLHFISLYLYVF